MIVFFSFLLLIYCFMLVFMMWGWLKPSDTENKIEPHHLPYISVVIAVRNEKENIAALLHDLHLQDYPPHLYEVIIIDDQSTDGTFEKVSAAVGNYKYHLQIHHLLESDEIVSTKKKAIQMGVDLAKGEIIITTDGDCRVGPKWISSFGKLFSERDLNFAAGMVAFFNEQTIFQRLQSVEFAVLTGIGAASIRMGYPTICNAANMAYRKKAFVEVGGYKDVENIISGDDGLLLEKLYALDKKKIHFLKERNSIVLTYAQETWTDFYHQRKRWASKWKLHKSPIVGIVAVFIFLFHITFLISFGLTLLGIYPLSFFLIQLFLKLLFDFAFIRLIYDYLSKKLNFAIFLTLGAAYSFYTVFFGFAANLGGFKWKGRIYNIKPANL